MYLDVNGYKINYKITGFGDEIVVLLQGWGTSCDIYDGVASSINSKYRVVQFDMPGFGDSDEPKDAWSVDDYADFFLEFMQKLEIKRAALWGHSYGGRVIIKLVSRESIPLEIDRVVLVDSAGVLPKRSLKQKIKTMQYKVIKKIVNINAVNKLFPELIDEWRGRQGSEDYKNATPIMRQCLVKAVNEDLTPLFKKNKMETLLVWGDLDTATPISDAKIMEEYMENAGLAVIQGTGHFCFIEDHAVFSNIMKSYFRIEE